jgi:glycosyltransferase involved in cell wall biosynthesis
MRFCFISEPTFETWDWSNPDTQGIGGSETSHIEMAQRLARRGHAVLSFAPVPWSDYRPGPDGVLWAHSSKFDPADEADVYVIYRAPQFADQLPEGIDAWLICQDVDYKDRLTEERARKFTRIVALCNRHADHLKARYPFAADKVCVSSNGIKRDRIERDYLESTIVRNPHRLMYASSPDRGMEFLLDIFPRAKEILPDLELHLYYGFDNIDKIVARLGPEHPIVQNTERLKQMIDQPGVTNHGRMGQPELLREWFKAGIWCHPSNFTETSCITCMDAQATGAIPLTSPLWAVEENVQHGVFIEGDVTSDLIRSRFVLEVVRLAVDEGRQDEIRREMMPWARERFDWERFVDQWETWARRSRLPAIVPLEEAVPA